MHQGFIITAVIYAVVGNAAAAGKGLSPQPQRLTAIVTEPLDRPQRLRAQFPGAVTHATLTQAEVVKLAKTAAKKAKGTTLDDDDLTSVIFDPTNHDCTVSFDPKPPRRAGAECLLVIVKDDTRETKVLRC